MTRPMPGPPEDCYCRDGNATCQECKTRGYPYPWTSCPGCDLHNGRSESHYKHLSDAECAAEYWRAVAIWSTKTDFLYGEAHQWLEHRMKTWHRFATRPHAVKETHDDRP